MGLLLLFGRDVGDHIRCRWIHSIDIVILDLLLRDAGTVRLLHLWQETGEGVKLISIGPRRCVLPLLLLQLIIEHVLKIVLQCLPHDLLFLFDFLRAPFHFIHEVVVHLSFYFVALRCMERVHAACCGLFGRRLHLYLLIVCSGFVNVVKSDRLVHLWTVRATSFFLSLLPVFLL